MVIEINRVPHRPRADPRERQEWFQRLDSEAQDMVRQRWLAEELDWERVGLGHRRSLQQDLQRGAVLVGGTHAVVVLVLGILLEHFTGGATLLNIILHVALATGVGVALGALWAAIQAGLLTCALTACITILVFELAVGMHWVFAVCAGLIGGLWGQYLGLRRSELPGC